MLTAEDIEKLSVEEKFRLWDLVWNNLMTGPDSHSMTDAERLELERKNLLMDSYRSMLLGPSAPGPDQQNKVV
jgi:hypothetical protein